MFSLRNHAGVLAALLSTTLLFAGLIIGCDAYMKTQSTVTPGKRVNAEQLQGEVAQQQAKFSGSLTDLNASYQKLQQQVTAYNGEVQAAQADLQQRQATVENVVNVLGGVFATAAKGSFDPLSLLTTIPTLAIGALGVGAMADKKNLQTALTQTRLLYTPPPAVPPDPGNGAPAAGATAANTAPAAAAPAVTLPFLQKAA